MAGLTPGKAQPFCPWPICGMNAAVDIGVICDHVLGFYQVSLARRLRSFGANLVAKAWGAIGSPRRSERVPGVLGDFVSEFCLGQVSSRVMRAQRIC